MAGGGGEGREDGKQGQRGDVYACHSDNGEILTGATQPEPPRTSDSLSPRSFLRVFSNRIIGYQNWTLTHLGGGVFFHR